MRQSHLAVFVLSFATLFSGVTADAWAWQDSAADANQNRFRNERLRREGPQNSSATSPGSYAGNPQVTQQDSLQPKHSSEGDQRIDVYACLTSPIADVDVPARTAGPLMEVHVLEMQAIQRADEMAKIDTELATLQLESAKVKLEAAEARASDDVSIRYAQAAFSVADKEKEINYKLARKGSLPTQEYERSKLAAQQASLQIEKSRHDLDVARKEAKVEEFNVNAAESALGRHSITSPLDGNVVQIFKEAGEWVSEGEKVFRIIRMDRMRVEGLLELSRYSPVDVAGKPVTVTTNVGGQQITFEGKVVMIDLESTGGKRFTVRAEVENRVAGGRWLLPSGAEVDMQIHMSGPVANNSRAGQLTPRR